MHPVREAEGIFESIENIDNNRIHGILIFRIINNPCNNTINRLGRFRWKHVERSILNQSYERENKTLDAMSGIKMRSWWIRVHSRDASLIASFDCLMDKGEDGQEESFARIGI